MMEVRETLCTHCVHREVCSNKEEFLSAMQAVNEVSVGLPSKDPNIGSYINLRDIKWIKPVELVCTHYLQQVPRIKERNAEKTPPIMETNISKKGDVYYERELF